MSTHTSNSNGTSKGKDNDKAAGNRKARKR